MARNTRKETPTMNPITHEELLVKAQHDPAYRYIIPGALRGLPDPLPARAAASIEDGRHASLWLLMCGGYMHHTQALTLTLHAVRRLLPLLPAADTETCTAVRRMLTLQENWSYAPCGEALILAEREGRSVEDALSGPYATLQSAREDGFRRKGDAFTYTSTWEERIAARERAEQQTQLLCRDLAIRAMHPASRRIVSVVGEFQLSFLGCFTTVVTMLEAEAMARGTQPGEAMTLNAPSRLWDRAIQEALFLVENPSAGSEELHRFQNVLARR